MTSLARTTNSSAVNPAFNPQREYPDPAWNGMSGVADGSVGGFAADPGRAKTDMDRVQELLPYFGPPPKPYKIAYQSHDKQHDTLTGAYEDGECKFVSDNIISDIKQADCQWTAKIAIFKICEKAMKVVWDRLLFNDHMLDRKAEENYTRLTTHKKEVGQDVLQQHGLSFLINSRFTETAKGREIYAGNLKQIANATAVTCDMGAAFHILNHKPFVDVNDMYRGNPTAKENHAYAHQERDNFAILIKHPHGIEVLLDRLAQTMLDRGIKPATHIIWPRSALKYAMGLPFYMTGEKNPMNKDPTGGPHRTVHGSGYITHLESYGFRTGNHAPAEDLNFRKRTIGGFTVINDHHLRNVPPEHYKTFMLDVIIYDEDEDAFVRIPYEEACRHSGLFYWGTDLDDCPISPIGVEFFTHYQARTWGEYLKNTGQLSKVVDKLYNDINNPLHGGEQSNAVFWKNFKQAFSITDAELTNADDLLQNDDEARERNDEERVRTFGDGGGFGAEAYVAAASAAPRGPSAPASKAPKPPSTKPPPPDASQKEAAKEAAKQKREEAKQKKEEERQRKEEERERKKQEREEKQKQKGSKGAPASKGDIALKNANDIQKQMASSPNGAEDGTDDSELARQRQRGQELPDTTDYIACKKDDIMLMKFEAKDNTVVSKIRKPAMVKDAKGDDTTTLLAFGFAFEMAERRVCVFNINPDGVGLTLQKIRDRTQLSYDDFTGLDQDKDLSKPFSRLELSLCVTGFINTVLEQVKKAGKTASANFDVAHITKALRDFTLRPVFDTQTFPELFDALGYNKKEAGLPQWMTVPSFQEPLGQLIKNVAKALLFLTIVTHDASMAPANYDEAKVLQLVTNTVNDLITKMLRASDSTSNGVAILDSAQFLHRYSLSKVLKGPDRKRVIEKMGSQAAKDEVQDLCTLYRAVVQEAFHDGGDSEELQQEQDSDIFSVYYNEIVECFNLSMLKDVLPDDAEFLPEIDNKARLKAYLLTIALLDRHMSFEGNKIDPFVSRIIMTGYLFNSLKTGSSLEVENGGDSVPAHTLIETLLENLNAEDALDRPEPRATEWIAIADNLNRYLQSDEGQEGFEAMLEKVHEKVKEDKKEEAEKIITEFNDDDDSGDKISRKMIEYLLVHDERFSVESAKFWKFCIRHNVYVGIGVLMFRPHQTYTMGSAVYIHGNGVAAQTLIGHNVFRIGSDTARDLIYGSFSVYFKTIVKSPKHVIIARDILPKGYEGGNGSDFWDPLDTENDMDDYQRGRMVRDIFACAVPIDYKPRTFYMDITGSHHPDVYTQADVDGELHYPTAHIYRQVWKWSSAPPDNQSSPYFIEELLKSTNTQVSVNCSFKFDYASGDFKTVTIEKGHWGDRVYEGCAKARRGAEKYLERPAYLKTNTFSLGF